MAQQVVKRYRLKKDMQMPDAFCKAGTESIFLNGYYNFPYQKGGGFFGKGFACTDPENYPDWFDEIIDEPFVIEWGYWNKSYGNGWKFMFKSAYCLTPEKFMLKIKKAIEDIVNGVDEKVVATYHGRPEEKTSVGFDEHAKIYSASEANQLQMEAFEAGKNRSWWIGNGITSFYGDPTYEDYKNSKK